MAAFAEQVDRLTSPLCRMMVRREQNSITRGELSLPQFWALEMVHEGGARPQHDLVSALQLKSSTGTVFVDRLVDMGLVRRERSTRDRRAVQLELTARGRRLVEAIHRQRRRALRRMYAPLTARERAGYLAMLKKLTREFLKEGP